MENKYISIKFDRLENSCFVVMPFNSLFQTQYEKIIKPVVSETGLKCIRGDEIYSKQRIMDDIWDSIRSCRLVIAELTDRNPNVLYEIGLAHAIGKPVIIITRNGDDVPFDLKDLRYLFYDINDPFWGDNLKLGLKNLIEKVLDNQSIGAYLGGINTLDLSDFPKLSKPKKEKIKPKAKYNLTGLWEGVFTTPTYNKKHQVTMHITQNDNELIGTATISYYRNSKDEITVVQQIMNGSINGSKVSLQGVNYSFINRGTASHYELDQFEFNVENINTISGKALDEQYPNGNDLVLERKTLPNNV